LDLDRLVTTLHVPCQLAPSILIANDRGDIVLATRGYRRLSTIRTIIFLIAGKLDFQALNPHVA
jgi:hypothetical protein